MTAKIVPVIDGKIVLPEELQSWAKSGEQLLAICEGDTLILKRLTPAPLTEIALRAPDEPELPLAEISAEVHRHREEKRSESGF
ncbi:MAG: hypothetical protein NZ805_11100 [Armatimonadetes bacterium]|nr:hypothetical protein [Armatimonadota bacterium]